ncbi:MAG: cobalamin-dependent protein [Candidatus Rokubacteria bacterium]|nr:cobalamin-dependent protein [Candidatus Rokubacteria bacterium]
MPERSSTYGVDLLLVNPGSRHQTYQALGESLAAIEPPVWAGLFASFARGRGHSVAILDANAEGLGPEQAAARVAEMRPRLTAVVVYGHQPSASTQNMPAAGAVCAAIKQRSPEGAVLLVGGHVAALPERTLEEEAADYVCSGEGPLTIVALLEALASGGADLARVPGLVYRDGGAVRSTPAAPLVQDVDREMPAVTWDLLPMTRYRAHNWHCFGNLERQPYAAMYTTLGCPYHCTFCCIQAPFKSGEQALGLKAGVNSYRFWSPARVIETLDTLVTRYGVRNVKFADEMFVLNAKHVTAIADAIIERGYDLNIWAYARVDTVRSDAMIEKMCRAGFTWLAFGIEAASEHVRDGVDKGFGQDDIFRALERVRGMGINVGANYIFGLPDDDHASMEATLALARELNTEWANFYCTMAYPGSPLYLQAQREGWALPGQWSGYSQHSVDSLPLPTKHLTAGEVLRFRDRAFQTYFTGDAYLAMIERKFGIETVRHVREMASHRLERRNA